MIPVTTFTPKRKTRPGIRPQTVGYTIIWIGSNHDVFWWNQNKLKFSDETVAGIRNFAANANLTLLFLNKSPAHSGHSAHFAKSGCDPIRTTYRFGDRLVHLCLACAVWPASCVLGRLGLVWNVVWRCRLYLASVTMRGQNRRLPTE